MLIPFANRIRNASYLWHGKEYLLPRNNGLNSIHGLTRGVDWDVEQYRNRVAMHTVIDRDDFPTELRCDNQLELSATSATIGFSFDNEGARDAPLTPGMHPYFLFRKHWRIKSPKEVRKLLYRDDYFPDGNYSTVSSASLSSDSLDSFDNCYEVGSSLTVDLGDHEIEIVTGNMQYFVVYNGEYSRGASVAVEPMVGAPDAFNNGIGLVTLPPGERFNCSASFRLSTTGKYASAEID